MNQFRPGCMTCDGQPHEAQHDTMTIDEKRKAIREGVVKLLHAYDIHVRECGMLRVEPSREIHRDIILAFLSDNGLGFDVNGDLSDWQFAPLVESESHETAPLQAP